MLEIIIIQLYAIAGLFSLAAYWPQIHILLKAENIPTEICIRTWTIWTCENFIALAYGVVALEDLVFCLLIGLDVVCMMVVIGLVIHRRYVLFGDSPSFLSAFVGYYLRQTNMQ